MRINFNQPAAAISAAALISLTFTGCNAHKDAVSTPPVLKAPKMAVQARVTPAVEGTIQLTALVTGVLTARNDVTVGVKSPGKLAAVYFREGDAVTAGEIVAQQDTSDLQAQLNQQQANLDAALSKLVQAQVEYNNSKVTLSITKSQTKAAELQAQAALNSAKEQAEIIQKGARKQQREQAKQQMAGAQAAMQKARSDLARYRELFEEHAIAAQQLDDSQSAFDQAQANYNAAVQAYDLLEAGSRPEEIRSAQDTVEQAQQTLFTAEANRNQVTLRRADVENAAAAIQAAKAGVAQAKASVQLAQRQLEDTSVKSPIDGVVAQREADPGEQMGAGKPVMRIVSLQNIYFDAQLPENQFTMARINQSVDVHIDALPGHTFPGKIHKIFPIVSQSSRSFTVRILLPNDSSILRPQMFARGTIILAEHRHAALVPSGAVVNPGQDHGTIFVIKNNTAYQKSVDLGFRNASQTEIRNGISPGDKIVIQGQTELQDNSPVQLLK